MIRRSTAIAAAAIVLSLLVHVLGLTITSRDPQAPTAQEGATDVVAMGNAFEDLAETVTEPVAPETAPVPEPPVDAPAEPELAEVPTSEALVASPSPQQVISPDTGAADAVDPDLTEPAEPGDVDSVDDGGATPPQEVDPPVEPNPVGTAPEGDPDGGGETTETAAVEPPVTPPVAPEPQPEPVQPLAALTVPDVPDVPVAPSPEISVVPAEPPETQEVEPDTQEATEPETVDTSPTDDSAEESALAVVSSVRPRLPDNRPSTEPAGQIDGSDERGDVRSEQRQVIESPLTLYRRDGIDLFGGQSDGTRSRRLGFAGSGGAGNADVTNYAGRVLVHLNRVPAVRVSARGAARVLFEINPDGSLAWVDIIDSTGSPDVERAAKAQVQNAAPFPAPPGRERRKLSFVYRIN